MVPVSGKELRSRVAVISDFHDGLSADPAINAAPGHRRRLADAAGYTARNPLGSALADVELLVVAGDFANKPRVRWPGAVMRLRPAAPRARSPGTSPQTAPRATCWPAPMPRTWVD